MFSPKPFMKYNQQLDKLSNDKNLVISNIEFADKILRQISYFALISGYKDLFLNPTTRKYKDGTTFEELVALYKLDESLRELFLKYLLLIEQKMRSSISYYFSEKYGENQQQYLTIANYHLVPSYTTKITKLIRKLDNIANCSNDYSYISYQRKKYGNVPLWVLVKVLTFGNIAYMYRFLPFDIQTKISKEFINVNEKELLQYLSVLVKFRNVCAHNERLFSFKTKDAIPNTNLHVKLCISKKGNQFVCGKHDLFSVVIALRYLLENDDFKLFNSRLKKIIYRFLSNTSHISENDLLNYMGFPKTWKKLTMYCI